MRGCCLLLALAGCGEEPLPPDGTPDMTVPFNFDFAAVEPDLAEPPPDLPAPPDLVHRRMLSFAPAVQYSQGMVFRFGVGTVDGNASPDVVVMDQQSNALLLLNDGQGKLALKGTYPTGFARLAVLGDVNGDKRADAIVGQSGATSVDVLAASNQGTLQAPVAYSLPAPLEVYALAAADLNGDKRADVITGAANSVLVSLAQANGTLGAATAWPGGSQQGALSVLAADLDGDGHLDVIASDLNFGVLVFLGKGNGALGPATTYPSMGGCAAVADFDEDGHPDLVACAAFAFDLRLGLGKGALGPPTHLSTMPNNPSAAAAADLDGDGHADLVVGSASGATVFLGRGDGTFDPPSSVDVSAFSLAVADLDGNGLPDLLLGGSDGLRVALNTSK